MKSIRGFVMVSVAALSALVFSCTAMQPAVAADARQQWISATYDTASLIDAAGASASITMAGAALGDVCVASLSVSTAGMTVTCNVTAANTVIVRIQNESTGTLDLDSATVRVLLFKKPL